MIKVGIALQHHDQAQFQFITNPVISQSFNYTQTVTGFRLSSAGFRPAVTNLNESLTIL